MKNKSALTLVELILTACIIFIFIGTFALYARITLKVAQETALISELGNIRMSIENYRIINDKVPADLAELLNKPLTINNLDSKIKLKYFLEPFRVDKQGYLLDPFFNRYLYIDGRVYSRTKGYERW